MDKPSINRNYQWINTNIGEGEESQTGEFGIWHSQSLHPWSEDGTEDMQYIFIRFKMKLFLKNI